MDEFRITPILRLPDELLLMILARVPFRKHQNYHNLRLVGLHWDDIFRQNVKNLPRQVAQQQYLHLYQIRNVIVPASSCGWPALRSLASKSQRLQAWIELLLPHGHHHVVTLGVTLIDAICSIRPTCRFRGQLQGDSNSTTAMLACSRLVRLVLPPQALLLIRYIVLLTDSALLTRHRLFPTAQLSYLHMSEAELEANRLCRFLVFEAKLLSVATDPPDLFNNEQRVHSFYDAQYTGAKTLRSHLESPNLSHHVHRASFLLHLTIDRLMKHLVPLPPTRPRSGEDTEQGKKGAEQVDSTHEHSTRQKLAALFQDLRDRNGVIRETFKNVKQADKLLQGIDLPKIVKGMREEYAVVTNLVAEELVLSAAVEEVKSLGLDNWPKSAYLDS